MNHQCFLQPSQGLRGRGAEVLCAAYPGRGEFGKAPLLLAFGDFGCYALCISLAQAETLNGRVVKIADGDTMTILDESNRQHKVRLVGIDAPERKQPFSTISRQYLLALFLARRLR